MCGINGIFAYGESAPPVDEAELLRTREHMIKRGPDGAGLWMSADRRVGLAHRRLAIIDLSETGAQPMATDDGQLRITFNGEIYNYRELRKELEGKGFRFRSNSDTEVLLHLYVDRGTSMLDALRGMYAFGIWDERRKGLFLARDPMGIKPLYYADSGDSVRFASQVKAIVAGKGVHVTPDAAGYVGFHLWGNVPEPYTMYAQIRSLPAGHFLWVDHKCSRRPERFFELASVFRWEEQNPQRIGSKETIAYIRASLRDSVRHHLVADVPVGVFLSSGIDSGVLAGVASEMGQSLQTVTLGFNEYRGLPDDEAPLAELVARNYGTTHRTSRITFGAFADELENVIQAMDQPTIDGINTYFVSKSAAMAGLKVAISGLGGDELFGGYSSFSRIPRLVRSIAPLNVIPWLGKAFRHLLSLALRHSQSPKYSGLLELGGTYGGAFLLLRGLYMPWELAGILEPDFARAGFDELRSVSRINNQIKGLGESRHIVATMESSWYMRNQLLRDADWAGMAHSLEIRVPFVDVPLIRALAPMIAMKTHPTKQDLAAVPAISLPREVTGRKKTGFTVPVRDWLTKISGRPLSKPSLRDWAGYLVTRWPKPLENHAVRRRETVLVFRVGQLGDTLVALPAISAIRNRHPGARFVLLTNWHPGTSWVSSWDILGPTGWFDEVVYYEPGRRTWMNAQRVGTVISDLRAMAPEAAYLLTPPRTRWEMFRDRTFVQKLVGVREVHSAEIHVPISRKPGESLPRVEPEWRRLLSIVCANDPAAVDLASVIPRGDADQAEWVLRSFGWDTSTRLLALGPGSKMPAKIWSEKNFLELAHRLLEYDQRLRLVVLGGAEDREIGKRMFDEMGPRVWNLAGRLSVYGSAAVLARTCGYAGNDTGTMHLAAMVGRPCVAIFSARDFPGHWEPYGSRHLVLRREVDCAGCMLEVCDKYHNKCLNLISVDEVLAGTIKMLDAAA